MNINLLTFDKEIDINEQLIVNDDLLKNTNINKLLETRFIGKLKKIFDSSYELSGILTGTMVLPDDVTLEDVNYPFNIEIYENIDEFEENDDNNLQIVNNSLDIFDFLWQNIVVEIPLKVTPKKNIRLEGNGWRLISEEDINNESPLREIENMIKGKE